MEVVKITKKIYKAIGCEEGHFFGTFAHFKELRERSNLSVQKTCFCCGHKFQPEDFISLACFDKGLGNKFLCQKCKDIAFKDLGDKNIYLHQCLTPSGINRQNMTVEDIINEECVAFETEESMDNIQSAEYFKENILPNEVEITHDDGNYFEVSVNGKSYSCDVYGNGDFYHSIADFKLLED